MEGVSSGTTSQRRLGAEDSATRAQLLDAAEALLVEDGYAAVTSRRVAARAGLKPQLVHYYFRTMDDLFVAVFRRRADENLARFERKPRREHTLRWLWRLNSDPRGARFIIEFAALANHRKAIRAEIAAYSERWQALQIEALREALVARGVGPEQMPATAALMIMTGLGQELGIQQALGITAGHDETIAFIEAAIDRLDAR